METARKLQQIRQRVIETIGNNMDLYGVTLSVGHMYGHMFFSNAPVTLDEMGQVMGMSKTSMSTGMRTLIDLKMVHRVLGKGSRKDLYAVEEDWYQTFVDYFSVRWRKSTEMNMQALKKALTELEKLKGELDLSEHAEIAETIARDERKMKEALKYYRWLERFIGKLESGEIFEFVPKEE